MNSQYSRLLIAGFVLLLFVSSVASAAEGLFVGYQFGDQSFSGDVTGSHLAGNLRIGYAFSGQILLGLRGGYGILDDYEFGGVVEYLLFRGYPFRPFVQAGWGRYGILVGVNDFLIEGKGPNVGFGFDYFVNRHVSIGLEVNKRFIHFERRPGLREDIDSEGTLVSLRWNVYYK